MTFKYKIAFRVSDPAEVEGFLDDLRAQIPTAADRPDFTVTLESDGFYFCDHTRAEKSSCAFRRLVDEALNYSEVVVHEL